MSDRRLDAYYYGFDSTGNEAIDKILGAVACAGKAYHHTDEWNESTRPYGDHTGDCPSDWIQNAAIEAAAVQAQHQAKAQYLANHMDEYGYMPSLGELMEFVKEVAGEN